MTTKKQTPLLLIVLLLFTLFFLLGTDIDPKGRKYFEQRGDIIWDGPRQRKQVALTFDDGPTPGVTDQIFALLKQYRAKATFFCLGTKVERYPHLARQMTDAGFEIANHSFDHKMFDTLSTKKILQELIRTQNSIYRITHKKPVLFRPPGGSYNEKIVAAAKKAQLQLVLWSWDQDTRDWQRPRPAKIVNHVLNHVSNGDIILFHDSHRNTVEALKKLLPLLQKQGYQFMTVSELIRLQSG
jgi:polysaccharide deacetylase family sporulation protein PdaB